jgi:hypothetical protein
MIESYYGSILQISGWKYGGLGHLDPGFTGLLRLSFVLVITGSGHFRSQK